ncbi:MAG: hypothetical protein R6V17_00420, partial [Halanaerobacter sp.]
SLYLEEESIELDEARLEELVDEWEAKLLPKHEQLQNTFTINEAEEFAEQLYKLAVEYEVKLLINYASQLQDQIAGFEVIKVKDTLEEFEDLLAKLNSLE